MEATDVDGAQVTDVDGAEATDIDGADSTGARGVSSYYLTRPLTDAVAQHCYLTHPLTVITDSVTDLAAARGLRRSSKKRQWRRITAKRCRI